MTENSFKSELLKQNGKSAVDEEVSRLHGIIAAEQRRVRRLAIWTIAVWALWVLMISLSLVMPMVAYHMARSSGPPGQATTMPVAPPPGQHAAGAGHPALILLVGVLMVGAFLGLPIAGIVLALMLILTRRTAGMNQVRASLAAIDAQLRALAAQGTGGSGPGQL